MMLKTSAVKKGVADGSAFNPLYSALIESRITEHMF